ncbi:MAG TPA: hypothetical protein ENI02_01950 [Candidatus Aminicenantes bacterium]|nr:hypothetical protein [Candidatus Aminicenantes bacterium]
MMVDYPHTCLFQDGGGCVRENVICFLILRFPDIPKNLRVFLEAILQHLFKPRQACQEGRLEARRRIPLDSIFLCDPVRSRQGRNEEKITVERMALPAGESR